MMSMIAAITCFARFRSNLSNFEQLNPIDWGLFAFARDAKPSYMRNLQRSMQQGRFEKMLFLR